MSIIKTVSVNNIEEVAESTRKERIFRNVTANLIILLCVAVVISLTVTHEIAAVFNSGAPQAIYRGDPTRNNVSLMVNVYWGTEYMDGMLEVLDKEEVKVTFFVGGTWVADNDELLVKIRDKGHEIGNHGYYHKDHKKISLERNRQEIEVTHKLVESKTDLKMNLFAPPSGSFDKNTLAVAHDLGYKTIMWSKDTIDWRDKNTELIYKRATNKLANGDLILMHPTLNTLEALEPIIHEIKDKGFNLVTVSQNIGTLDTI